MKRRKGAAQNNPAKTPRLTAKGLVKLLGSLPTPDDEYLAIVEDLARNQPLHRRHEVADSFNPLLATRH